MRKIDSHQHPTDMTPTMADCSLRNPDLIFACCAKESEWYDLTRISAISDAIIPFFGTHPWYADGYTGPDKLTGMLAEHPRAGVGEIGLDRWHNDMQLQMSVFTEQLIIADELGRPVTIHMAGTEEHILREIRHTDVPIILHSFSGPRSYIGPFTSCNCYFSISPRFWKIGHRRTEGLLEMIPADRLLIETDAPNNDVGIPEMTERISCVLGISADELSEIVFRNMVSIIP